ncbi:ComF family protein [Lactobacillus sp. Sy-1]|uniref:ComF family protein n=1 Tax=Lactobacillus sp. Sy-1 TaxID=2109645 RepID=UPI001C5B1D20|nr:phosphoribosyltransferase family protein [Lactobacillus sp. Sy-1]MBW1605965.1 ComF family protein [Lactobacillus sp. Sy-1]
MHRYKFVGDYQLRNVFLEQMSNYALATKRLVVPIPLTPGTLQKRAFNQTLGLLSVPTFQCLETKGLHKQTDQSKRGREQRKAMKQPFKLVAELADQVVGQDVLIVDDVYTTGTTIRFAAQLLVESGAKSVRGLTLAR